jgi:hypothetical protein
MAISHLAVGRQPAEGRGLDGIASPKEDQGIAAATGLLSQLSGQVFS